MTRNELEERVKKTSLHYHHRATAKGYVRKGCGRIEEYDGRFGKGYKMHVENAGSGVDNNYHYVEYYIYCS